MTQDTHIKHKVLLVDDHPIFREGFKQVIDQEPDLMMCCESADVSGAMHGISDCGPDVVIVDLSLGRESGLRIIENLKYENSDLPVLVLSMYDEAVYAERCIKTGAKGYIMKTEPTEKMILAIKKVLSGKMFISENMGKAFLHEFVSGKTGDPHSPVQILSNRELEVYQLFGQGMRKGEIAGQLNLSVKTVETYVESIKKKMGFSSIHNIIMHSIRFMNETLK